MTNLSDWIGRAAESSCWLDPWRAQALHATLDLDGALPDAGDPLPPGWHWTYFLDAAPSRELGPDGHPRRGGFPPPVELPRRRWAGSSIEFLEPLRLGERARRVARVVDIEEKSGRSGRLCFVTVDIEIHGERGVALRERQSIVYRDPPTGGGAASAQQAPAEAAWKRDWRFDAPRLFRYSALMFNSHRIHYDREYAMREEGYPGLVVQGPLLATSMLELVREKSSRPVRRFEFRALAPVFDGELVQACAQPQGDRAELWIGGANCSLHMRGAVELG